MKWTIATMVGVLVVIFTILTSTSPADVPIFTTQLVPSDVVMFAATLGSVMSQEPLIHRGEIPHLLKTTLGIKLGKSTVAKLFSPAIGQGCAPVCYWGRKPMYRASDIIAWARSRLRPGPGIAPMSTEELPPHENAKSVSEPEARANHQESMKRAVPAPESPEVV